jgi:hypothetical protein
MNYMHIERTHAHRGGDTLQLLLAVLNSTKHYYKYDFRRLAILFREAGRNWYLSVFDDRQLLMGLPGTMVGGLRRTLNSVVNARDDDLY